MQAAAVGLVVECRVFNATSRGPLLVPEVSHCSEEECEPSAVLRNVVCFLARLHLQDSILLRVEAFERRGFGIELVAENDDQMSERHDEPLSRSMVSTRAGADCSKSEMAAVSGMFRQYFFGMCRRIASGLARAGLNTLS